MTRRCETGAVAVETAVLVALFLVPLLFGIVDVGRAIYVNIVVEEAAQEGASYAAFEGDTLTVNDVEKRVIESVSFPDLSDETRATIIVTCDDDPRTEVNGSDVVVSVSYQLSTLTPFVSDFTLVQVADAEGFTRCPTEG